MNAAAQGVPARETGAFRPVRKRTGMAAFLALAILLVAGGCNSVGDLRDRLQEGLSVRGEPHVRQFSGTRKDVYNAALAAMKALGFQFQRGGPAEGELQGMSGLETSTSGQESSQRILTVRLENPSDTETEVRVWLEEYVETDPYRTTGRPSGAAVRESSLYDAFFRALQQALPPEESP